MKKKKNNNNNNNKLGRERLELSTSGLPKLAMRPTR